MASRKEAETQEISSITKTLCLWFFAWKYGKKNLEAVELEGVLVGHFLEIAHHDGHSEAEKAVKSDAVDQERGRAGRRQKSKLIVFHTSEEMGAEVRKEEALSDPADAREKNVFAFYDTLENLTLCLVQALGLVQQRFLFRTLRVVVFFFVMFGLSLHPLSSLKKNFFGPLVALRFFSFQVKK